MEKQDSGKTGWCDDSFFKLKAVFDFRLIFVL